MSGFIEIVNGSGPVTDDHARVVFRVLAPLLVEAPDDAEAVDAAARTVTRMSRESRLAAVLDWWLVAATGSASPLGLAFHLPDSLPQPVRDSMEAVAGLGRAGIDCEPTRWVQAGWQLQRLLSELDEHLVLDNYGRSKLPAEREVWAHLQEELRPTVQALHEGRRAVAFELDVRAYEKEMKRAGISDSSRRWNEMLKRAHECVERVNGVVEVQRVVEPWVPRPLPPLLGAVPADLHADLSPLGPLLLGSIIEPGEEGAARETELTEALPALLEEIAQEGDERGLSLLASFADSWMDRSGAEVPSLASMVRRRHALEERIERLRAAGVDVDEAELLLLDHEVAAVEELVARLEDARKHERRTAALRSALDQLGAAAGSDDALADWRARLGEAFGALDAGRLDAAEQLRRELDLELRAARRSEALEELRHLSDELRRLHASAGLLRELDEHLRDLDDRPDGFPDAALVQRSRERLDSLRAQRRREAEQSLLLAHELLEGERNLLRTDALASLELRLDEAERVLAADDLIGAVESAAGLVADIEAQRVHRWRVSEGEAALVAHIVDFCTQQLHFDPDDVRRLYVAAKTKPFVILAGLTGSGKSTIARLFAAAVGSDAANGRFRRVAVRPDWIDQSEVLGTLNPMSNRFEPGWLAEVARQCERSADDLHVVLLDELNLAPVEQYLAEYLSAIEEARSGADTTVLPLYSSAARPENADEWPPVLPFPSNLIVIGTVNIDETTRVLSERVLDRANVLQLSVAVSDAHHRPRGRTVPPWVVPFPEWDGICERRPDDAHHEFLVEVGQILQSVGIGLGQRSHIELERFVANARGVLDPVRSLDLGVLQRVVPKIRGFKRDLVDGLVDLHDLLVSTGCERSAAAVGRWLDERISDDEYLDGTDTRIGLLR